jgi:chemotaxis signal transduction protein
MNHRGSLVTVIDLGARLRGILTGDEGSVLLCQARGKRFGVAVDDVHDVQRLSPLPLPPDGRNGDLARGTIVSAVGQVDDDLAPIVDLEAMADEVFGSVVSPQPATANT